MKILKNLLIALGIVIVIVLLANLLRPDNYMAIGSGFTRTVPSVNYPIKASFIAALLWFAASFPLSRQGKFISFFVILILLIAYTIYCSSHYVQ